MRKQLLFGCLCTLMLGACSAKKVGNSFYEVPGFTPVTSASDLKVVVLNNGLVEEYPRTRFDETFGEEKKFTEELIGKLPEIIEGLDNDQVQTIADERQISGVKYALRTYFGMEAGQKDHIPGSKPLRLPRALRKMEGPYWLITDWEFQVNSHMDFGGGHQAPGGRVMKPSSYSYYQIRVFGLTVNQEGHVTRYIGSMARGKYNANAKKLPLRKLLNEAVTSFAAQMMDDDQARLAPMPRSFYRR